MAASDCPNQELLKRLCDGQLSGQHETRMVAHIDQCTECQIELDLLQASANEWIKYAATSSPTTYSNSLTTRLDKIKSDRADLVGSASADSKASRFQDLTPWFDPMEDAGQTSNQGPIIGRIAEFDLLELIGRGGMGAVFKAFDRKLERLVALKVMAPSLLADPNSSKRFLREARSAAGISHPNAVAVHSVGENRGLPYLVMEFVEGESLHELLQRTPRLPLDASLAIVEQLAKALAAAHKTGVIHRDVKPANVLIESDTKAIKLTDFGLARTAGNSLTSTGLLMGTPGFLAPEQLTSADVDHRVDLFSLGSVLYLLCAGKVPFDGPSAHAIMTKISQEEPTPIQELEPTLPPAIADLVGQLLQKNPEHRPESASQVAALIGAFRSSAANQVDTQPATPIPSPSKFAEPAKVKPKAKTTAGFSPWWIAAAAIPVLVCTGWLGWLGWSGSINPNSNEEPVSTIVAGDPEQSESPRRVWNPNETITLESSEEWIEFFGTLESSELPRKLYVELESDEKFLVEPFEFEDREISVVAAAGFEPTIVFELEDDIESCISVEGGTLHLDGIAIETNVEESDEVAFNAAFEQAEENEKILAIVYCEDGTIRLDDCRLVSQHLSCIHVEESKCILIDCEILSGENAGVQFSTSSAGRLEMENCMLAGEENLSVGLPNPGSIDLINNTFIGEFSISFYPTESESGQVTIDARNNVFDAARCMLLFGETDPDLVDEIGKDLKWIGDANLLPKSLVQCLSELDKNLVVDSDQISKRRIVDSNSVMAEPMYSLERAKIVERTLDRTLRVEDIELSGEQSEEKYGVQSSR